MNIDDVVRVEAWLASATPGPFFVHVDEADDLWLLRNHPTEPRVADFWTNDNDTAHVVAALYNNAPSLLAAVKNVAALSARVAKLEAEQSEARNRAARLEAALRPFAAFDFAGSICAEYVADGETPESVAVLCAYANGKPTGVNVTMADFNKARAALEEPCKGDSPEAAEEDKP